MKVIYNMNLGDGVKKVEMREGDKLTIEYKLELEVESDPPRSVPDIISADQLDSCARLLVETLRSVEDAILRGHIRHTISGARKRADYLRQEGN